MSAESNARGETNGKGKQRGSVNNQRRLDAFTAAKPSARADWGECDAGWMQAVVRAITSLGGACTFGVSRDGGASSLTLLLDGERQTLWFNRDANLNEELERVYATLETMM